MNVEQLIEKYADEDDQKSFITLFSMLFLFKNSIKVKNYTPSNSYGNAICLTPYGNEWFNKLRENLSDLSDEELKFSLLYTLYHRDLFIDLKKIDINQILDVFTSEIKGGKIKFPDSYNRSLYDKYFILFTDHFETLSFENTQKLIKGTPNGVFQMYNLIVGPLGVLISDEKRYFPPQIKIPLCHCRDPSCTSIHISKLATWNYKSSEVLAYLIKNLLKKSKSSEFVSFYSKIITNPLIFYDDFHLIHLLPLLSVAFNEEEIRLILCNIIKNNSKEIRQKIPRNKRFDSIFSNSPSKIVIELTKNECLQIILTMSNEDIIYNIEFLLDENVLKIPFYEVRNPWVSHDKNAFDCTTQISRYGVRSISKQGGIGMLRLKRLVKQLYFNENDIDRLDWNLRNVAGENIYEKLDYLINQDDPRKIIREYIFSSKKNLEHTFENLKYGRFLIPTNKEEENELLERILWKLGFRIQNFPKTMEIFWKRLKKFLNTARTNKTYSEIDKEMIRSAGVNLFVSIEEILEKALSFCTWMFLSDHFRGTKYKFNSDYAQTFMVSKLNGRLYNSEELINFDSEGRITLFPLVQGFKILADLCENLLNEEDQYSCLESELPGYFGKTEILSCPFTHKLFLFDINKQDCNRFLCFLREITLLIDKSPLYKVRNGIDHKRTDETFPIQEEIEEVCDIIKSLVEKMEVTGVFPLIYLLKEKNQDQYGRIMIKLTNYKGMEILFYDPSQFDGCMLPEYDEPLIIVPWIHIGNSAENIRYKYEEISEYSKFWHDYPKKRPKLEQKLENDELQ